MEDIVAIAGFFATVIIVTLGFPLVRSWTRRREMEPPRVVFEIEQRLSRMETAIESMAVEIERVSEGQRFVTKLLADREQSRSLPSERP